MEPVLHQLEVPLVLVSLHGTCLLSPMQLGFLEGQMPDLSVVDLDITEKLPIDLLVIRGA